ncbi:PBS lyase HEAT-like repeat protein [Maioricimonas rarisocia]|uniref:PBS lyase HEAT-like repeat protein n=1 Tax=Maioricimonas rarisocia TaxID=2528026 RepID=A0A517ZA14_9PLAN|nr:HEAT repeat domain-containing protein [Maioricimonas rarisocia]QDU39337.1 PBS lyase HEAT-like repeat protein [Maioricimonas rarisocia]
MGPTEILWRLEDGTFAERVPLASESRASKATDDPEIPPRTSTRTDSQRRHAALLAQLQSPSVRERRAACYEAEKHSHPEIVKALARSLARYPYPQYNADDNEFYCTVKGAAYALGRLQQPSTRRYLLEAMSWDERQPHIKGLFTWGTRARAGLNEAHTDFARAVIDDFDSGARAEPKLHRRFRKQVPSLISQLQNAFLTTGERMEACFALALANDRRAVPPLIKCLEQNDLEVRRTAAYALARIGDRSALGPLLNARKVARTMARQARSEFIGMTVVGATPADRLLTTVRSAIISLSPWRRVAHGLLFWTAMHTLFRGEDHECPESFLREDCILLLERF